MKLANSYSSVELVVSSQPAWKHLVWNGTINCGTNCCRTSWCRPAIAGTSWWGPASVASASVVSSQVAGFTDFKTNEIGTSHLYWMEPNFFYNVFLATRSKTTSLPAALNQARRIDTLDECYFIRHIKRFCISDIPYVIHCYVTRRELKHLYRQDY